MFLHWVATICDQLTLHLSKDKQQIPTEIINVQAQIQDFEMGGEFL